MQRDKAFWFKSNVIWYRKWFAWNLFRGVINTCCFTFGWKIHFPPWFIMDCIYTATYIPALLTYFSRLVSNVAAVVSPKCNPQEFFHQHWPFLHQPIASDDGGRTQGQEVPSGTSDSSVHSSTVSSSQLTVEVALKFFPGTLKPDFAFSSVQFSPVTQSCLTLRPHESQHARPPCSSPTPGVHSNSHPSSRWCHATSHLLSSPSPPAPNPSQHQSLFQWVNSLHEVAKVLEFQL